MLSADVTALQVPFFTESLCWSSLCWHYSCSLKASPSSAAVLQTCTSCHRSCAPQGQCCPIRCHQCEDAFLTSRQSQEPLLKLEVSINLFLPFVIVVLLHQCTPVWNPGIRSTMTTLMKLMPKSVNKSTLGESACKMFPGCKQHPKQSLFDSKTEHV